MVTTVLDRVCEKMKTILTPNDYEYLLGSVRQIRWRNTAQWARNTMVSEDGRMKKGSPNGYCEISDNRPTGTCGSRIRNYPQPYGTLSATVEEAVLDFAKRLLAFPKVIRWRLSHG